MAVMSAPSFSSFVVYFLLCLPLICMFYISFAFFFLHIRCTSGTIRFLAEIHGIKLLLEKLNYKKQFSGVYRYLDNSLDAEDSVNFAKEKYTFACPDKKVFSPIAKRLVFDICAWPLSCLPSISNEHNNFLKALTDS